MRTRTRGPGSSAGRPAEDQRAWWEKPEHRSPTRGDAHAAAAPADRPYWAEQEAGRIGTLAAAAAAMQHATDEHELFEAIGEAVGTAGLSGHISTLDEDGKTLTVRKAIMAWVQQGELERMRGVPLVGQRIVLETAPAHATVVGQERSMHAPAPLGWVIDATAGTTPAEMDAIGAFLGVGEALLAPITDGRTVFGVLTLWAPALSAADVSAAELLGRLAGGAMAGQRDRAAAWVS